VRYRFVVTNATIFASMTNVTITDPQLASECAPAPFTIVPGGVATVDCEWSGGWPPGLTTNTASVTAQPAIRPFGTLIPVGAPVTASDIAIVSVNPAPAIQVIKDVEGIPADTAATAARVITGGTASFRYAVTNRGLEPVTVTSLVDNNEPGLVFNATVCTRPDGLALTAPLPANGTIVCLLTVNSTDGLVLGTASVRGVGVTSVTSVFDTDPGWYRTGLAPAAPPVVPPFVLAITGSPGLSVGLLGLLLLLGGAAVMLFRQFRLGRVRGVHASE